MSALLPPEVKLGPVIESVRLRCALGIRFRDTATRQVVASGLRVRATPKGAAAGTEPVTAKANLSGVWTFHGLRNLRAFELGTEEFPERGSPPGPPAFRIEVQDTEGRFLPCAFDAAPSPTGPFQFAPALSPPWDGDDVPLFSAPSRPLPPGCAVIRASLVAALPNKPVEPAGWALLEASATVRNQRVQAVQALGVADRLGNVAIMFPWPELVTLTVGSPPGGLHLEEQGWPFEFTAWHDSAVAEYEFADLDGIVARLAQSPDTLAANFSPQETFTHATLKYGRELVLPENGGAPDPPRILIIT
jgi:hypothetical protein